ncbi:pantetheine-phosphate adenylyltransferase [Tardisphaera miroshnichenkoae]
MPCFDKGILGGTFDFIHKGHRELLETAFKVAETVTIGLTTDEFAMKRRKIAHAYEERRTSLAAFLDSRGFAGRYNLVPISDPVGPALGDYDVLIVSEETLPGAKLVNEARVNAGVGKLILVVVPMALAYDKKPISSTRIREGEIDEEGNRVEL